MFIKTLFRKHNAVQSDSYSNIKTQIYHPSDSEIKSWVSILHKCYHDLNTLTSSTEPQFLFLGTELRSFSDTAKQISQLSFDITQAVVGNEIDNAIYDLEEMLSRISLYLGHCDQELEYNIQTLNSIMEITSKVEDTLQGFGKIVKMMRMLGVTTRIENAQLNVDKTNFSNLSSQVLKLSEDLDKKSKSIRDGVTELAQFSYDKLSGVIERNEKRSEQANEIIINMQHCLEALKEKYNLSSATAMTISKESQDISDQINNVVMSMQFHDICRQRIEHVSQTLYDLSDALESVLSNGDMTKLSDPKLHEMAGTCELQTLQLNETEETIGKAVNQMIQSLKDIGQHVDGMGYVIHKMVMNSDTDHRDSFEQMEQGITEVGGLLRSNLALSVEIDSAIRSIAETIEHVEQFVLDINELGSDIELIALNGLIKAAHMGEQGATLSILADAIQKLSLDARKDIEQVSTVLKEISDSTDSLRFGTNDDSHSSIESVVEQMIGELDGFVEKLRDVTLIVHEKMNQIESNSKPFVTAVNDNIVQIDIHTTFHEVISTAVVQIHSLIESIISFQNSSDEMEIFDHYESMKENYTMHEEREVHTSFLQGRQLQKSYASNKKDPFLLKEESPDKPLDHFDNNIELF